MTPRKTRAAARPAQAPPDPVAVAAARAAVDEAMRAARAAYAAVRRPLVDVQSQRMRLRQIYESAAGAPWVLPSWQRPVVWSRDQSLAFHSRIMGQGGTFGPIVLWDRRAGGQRDIVVLDGQQRLSAIGVTLVREVADGGERVPAVVEVPLWDTIETGWSWAPGAHRYPLSTILDPSLRDGPLWDARRDGQGREWAGAVCAHDAAAHIDVPIMMIEAHWQADDKSPDAQKRAAMRAFVEMNTGGTPMSRAEIEALIGLGGEDVIEL